METIRNISPITPEKSASYDVTAISVKNKLKTGQLKRENKLITALNMAGRLAAAIISAPWGCTDPRVYESQKKSQNHSAPVSLSAAAASINPNHIKIKPVILIKKPASAKPLVLKKAHTPHKVARRSRRHFHPIASKNPKINNTTVLETYGPPAPKPAAVIPVIPVHDNNFIYPGGNILLGSVMLDEKAGMGFSMDVIASELSKQETANVKAGSLSLILSEGNNLSAAKKLPIKSLAYNTQKVKDINNPDNLINSIVSSETINGWKTTLLIDYEGKLAAKFIRVENEPAFTIDAYFAFTQISNPAGTSLKILKTYPKDNGNKLFLATDSSKQLFSGIMGSGEKIEILYSYDFQ